MIWDVFKKLDAERGGADAPRRGNESRWLVAGLGNPGAEYAQTRHNVGFMLIEHLARRHNITAKSETRFKAIVGTGRIAGVPVILAEPLTYMNLSGESVKPLMDFYDIPPERLLVVYDDAALPFGKVRIRPEGSAGGQNGMKSIIAHLGGNQRFARLRVGIGAPKGQRALSDHVLSRFTLDEFAILESVLNLSAEATACVLELGVEAARNRYNGLSVGVPEPPKPFLPSQPDTPEPPAPVLKPLPERTTPPQTPAD